MSVILLKRFVWLCRLERACIFKWNMRTVEWEQLNKFADLAWASLLLVVSCISCCLTLAKRPFWRNRTLNLNFLYFPKFIFLLKTKDTIFNKTMDILDDYFRGCWLSCSFWDLCCERNTNFFFLLYWYLHIM